MSENFNVEKRNYFTNGGKINIDMLNRVSNGTADSLNNINKLLYTPGVLFLPITTSQNFLISENSNSGDAITINVGFIGDAANAAFGGVAIDNEGRFIVINKNEYYVGCTEDALSYNINNLSWKSPVRTSDPNLALTDGVGPTGKYYRNSGNVNIPLQINIEDSDAINTNYVYIKYLQVVDQTSSSSQTTTDGLNTYDSEVMYVGGYSIRVINPEVAEGNEDILDLPNFDTVLKELGYIKIGEVALTKISSSPNTWRTSFSTTGSMTPTPDRTQYAYFNGSMVGAPFIGYSGGVDYPTITGTYVDFYTHANALGSGNVSERNPHGLSAADIGIDISGTVYHTVSTETAVNTETYTLDNPLLNLEGNDNYRSYDTILINAADATNSSTNVTVRLPSINSGNKDLRYTIKRIDTNSNVTVSVSTIVNSSNNYLDSNTVLVNDTYSVQGLGILGSTNSCITLCIGQAADNKYNWYII